MEGARRRGNARDLRAFPLPQEDSVSNIEDAVEQASRRAAQLPGVAWVGQGEEAGEPVIRIELEAPHYLAQIRSQIPANVDGFRVVFQVGGPVRAQ